MVWMGMGTCQTLKNDNDTETLIQHTNLRRASAATKRYMWVRLRDRLKNAAIRYPWRSNSSIAT
jgi:hypothetical protein